MCAGHRLVPEKLDSLSQYRMKSIHAGCKHTVALTESGVVYTWGSNTYGQLGHGDKDTRLEPKLLEHLRDIVVLALRVGDFHTAALVR